MESRGIWRNLRVSREVCACWKYALVAPPSQRNFWKAKTLMPTHRPKNTAVECLYFGRFSQRLFASWKSMSICNLSFINISILTKQVTLICLYLSWILHLILSKYKFIEIFRANQISAMIDRNIIFMCQSQWQFIAVFHARLQSLQTFYLKEVAGMLA